MNAATGGGGSVNQLGDLLARTRSERTETLRQVENATGIPNAHICQIEKGHIKTPSPNVVWGLAMHYGLDFAKLMDLAGHPVPAGRRKQRNLVAGVSSDDRSHDARAEQGAAIHG